MVLAVFIPVVQSSAQQEVAGQPQRALEVTVVNGTPDGHSVVGDRVTVRIFRGQELVDTLQGEVNSQSKAIIDNVPQGENLIARISCDHDGATFYGNTDIPLIPSHPLVAPQQVRVFDVVTDTSSLSIIAHHIIIRRGENFLRIGEYMRVENDSFWAIKPEIQPGYEKPAVIEIFLPAGFKNFTPESYFVPQDLVWTDEGFYDPIPITPGQADIRFSYTLDIKSTDMEINKKFSLPTDDCAVFLSLPQAKPQGLGPLVTTMSREDGVAYDYYSLGPRRRVTRSKFN